MRQITIAFAPDGMNAGARAHETRQSAERPARREADEFDHDDGLVHEHAWARTSPERT
jgi:hypothetical protein